MIFWLGFLAGILTIPAGVGTVLLAQHAFLPLAGGSWGGGDCAVCGKTIRYRRRFTGWFLWFPHNFITRRTRWHRIATAVWRIEVGRDPITGKFED
ncbi:MULTISPECIES: hypothetical protein [unclassified Microbacterium]|uniref:hypothetical protein n=1 Tax=unclassified Microbacterium TaxID=2609290 RepID=UPI002469285F|nr:MULTISPECIES: hypothetical protein [unclassified Microbacterium]MDH5135014.1 hypothetical protein [Microbacterium sp. RD10]MDH5138610.1 hypothetical protein [Microbacterium sp. RD11]MDH5147009.1 hypothetical protein [Microbacterium sp. RD12]MDH5156667.1 hypothetical protein [Microbacterium sp. RD06]MDH5168143.1 hypothetical protein [Microbacterium sp. RD02]